MSAAPTLQFAHFTEQQPQLSPEPKPEQNWTQDQPCEKKPPRGVGGFRDFCLPIRERTSSNLPQGLDDAYVIVNRPVVARFIEENRLAGLLLRAKGPLVEAFGEQAIKQLALISDEEGFETLFCSVLISGDMQQARQVLRKFDETWWLDNVKDAAGRLNFDFQMA